LTLLDKISETPFFNKKKRNEKSEKKFWKFFLQNPRAKLAEKKECTSGQLALAW